MGLDATIRRRDGQPLGDLEAVIAALKAIWPGAEFGRRPSGREKIEEAAKHGIEYPPVLADHFATAPATTGGIFEGDDYSVEFHLGSDRVVEVVDIVLRGKTENCESTLAGLPAGWTITFP